MEEPKTRILVVDDDVALLGVMETSLQMKPGYNVQVTNSAPNALKLTISDGMEVLIER